MKIYTKTGDKGTTGLWGGGRVSKANSRVDSYGNTDETVSWLGLILEQMKSEKISPTMQSFLQELQLDLFEIGTELASSKATLSKTAITEEHISKIEQKIDWMEEQLPPLQSFVLPGGSILSAQIHIARTVCRRAERSIVFLADNDELSVRNEVIQFFNRLSDFLFSFSRYVLLLQKQPEVLLSEARRK